MASGFEQEMHVMEMGSGDRISINFHGWTTTHLDALCHIFAGPENALYNGRPPPTSPSTAPGAAPSSRTTTASSRAPCSTTCRVTVVRTSSPSTRLSTAGNSKTSAAAQGVEPMPGDAVVVRSGANAFYASRPDFEMGMFNEMPGVHGSAIEFLYNNDASVLVWDLLDAGRQPLGYGLQRPEGPPVRVPIHEIVIPYMGMPLLDNANLDDLAEACAEAGRWEFLLMVAPLRVRGGTGSPVNPIAVV